MAKQMTLGEMIGALERLNQDGVVKFAFGNFAVGNVDSYRGYYHELAIGYGPPGYRSDHKTVGAILKTLRAAVGATFHGYKGGEYAMGINTPMWASNHGNAFAACISGVTATEYGDAVIETSSSEACGR